MAGSRSSSPSPAKREYDALHVGIINKSIVDDGSTDTFDGRVLTVTVAVRTGRRPGHTARQRRRSEIGRVSIKFVETWEGMAWEETIATTGRFDTQDRAWWPTRIILGTLSDRLPWEFKAHTPSEPHQNQL
jgi:hypothetical protein